MFISSPYIQHLGQCQIVNLNMYLGALISNEGVCSLKVNRRCYIARKTTKSLTWWYSAITMNKENIFKILKVLIDFTIRAETWSLKLLDRKKNDALELWCLRSILWISWSAKRSNTSIIQENKELQRPSKIV